MAQTDTAAQQEWLHRVLGLNFAVNGRGSAGEAAETPISLGDVRKRWSQAISLIRFSLGEVEAAINESGDPLGSKAIIMIKSVSANLNKMPETRQQIDEVARYIKSDDVIDDLEMPNKFDIHIDIRQPLGQVLKLLKAVVTA